MCLQRMKGGKRVGARVCPTGALVKAGNTQAIPHWAAHGGMLHHEELLSSHIWLTASWSRALPKPMLVRVTAPPICLVTWATQTRPLFFILPHLHCTLDAFTVSISLESCGGLKRLIIRTVRVPENRDECQLSIGNIWQE